MAKQTTTKASEATVPAESVETKTKEIEVLGMTLNAGDLLKQLDDAKPEEFEKIEDDVWKPSTVGDILLGVLVAREDSGFGKDGETVNWWHFVTKSLLDGALVSKRVLGTTILERGLRTLDPGTLVEIEFIGEQPSKVGNPLKLYTLRIPKKARKA